MNTTTMAARTSPDPKDMATLGTAELIRRYAAATNDGEKSVLEAELKTRTIKVNVNVKNAQEGEDQVYVNVSGAGRSHESGWRKLKDGGEFTFSVPVSKLHPITGVTEQAC
jgi:hypothetical protein